MKIGFLGDSITFGYSLENKETQRYPYLICNELKCEECNFGITGTLVARAGLSRSDGTAFIDRVELLRGCDFAVVFGGTNDYNWSDMPIAPGDNSQSDEYFTNAVKNICIKLKEFIPNDKILFVAPYPHRVIGNYLGAVDFKDSSDHETDAKNYTGSILEEYCDKIDCICSQQGVTVLNLHKVSGFDYKTMTTDGCHPNEQGHIWLSNIIGEKIKKMI